MVTGIIGLATLVLSIIWWYLKQRPKETPEKRLKNELKAKRKNIQQDYKNLKEGKLDEVQKSLDDRIDNILNLDKLRRKKNNPK